MTSPALKSPGIGFGLATAAQPGGGLGKMDLSSRKLSSFTPSLNRDSAVGSEKPPRGKVNQIAAGADGDVWLSEGGAARQFHVARGSWESLPNELEGWETCLAADSQHLILGTGINLMETELCTRLAQTGRTNEIKTQKLVISYAEFGRLRQEIRTNGLHQWFGFEAGGGTLPKARWPFRISTIITGKIWKTPTVCRIPPSTLTLDGDNLWVGGEGAIALVDLRRNSVRKFCHLQAGSVDRIQIAAGYVWAQFDCHLYRALLSAVQ